ncbi:hypothetical protein PsWM33_05177 [Pseudovibrio sp. WM33]|nr:hypothetical protein PsWM33_05177 [Pseudovibrio sp. WM33]
MEHVLAHCVRAFGSNAIRSGAGSETRLHPASSRAAPCWPAEPPPSAGQRFCVRIWMRWWVWLWIPHQVREDGEGECSSANLFPPHTLSSCAERSGDPGPLTTSRGALHSRYAAIIVWVTAWGPRLLVMRCVRMELVSRTALPGDQWQATEPGSGFHPSTSRFSAASFSRLGS